jgi:hypothetical protein
LVSDEGAALAAVDGLWLGLVGQEEVVGVESLGLSLMVVIIVLALMQVASTGSQVVSL